MQFVWIVGGSLMQLPMLEEVHKRGYGAIVSDGANDFFLKKHLTKTDIPVIIDTYDHMGHAKHALMLHSKGINIVAVVATGVDVGPTASAIAEVLHLIAVPLQVALNVRNKATMRTMLNFEHPAYTIVHSPEDAQVLNWSLSGYMPCITKPVDNCASRGMTVVKNVDDLSVAIDTAIKASKISNAVLIEEMLDGSEAALDFIILDGKAVWVNGVIRLFRHHIPHTKKKLFGIEGAIINPFVPDEELTNIATVAAQKLGVTEGPFKIDALYDKNYGWCILECATRWSGGFDSGFLAPMVGRNIMKVLLDYALGQPVSIPPLTGKFAASYVPYYKPMKLKYWDYKMPKERLESYYKVKHVFIRSQDEIKDLRDCAERPIFVLASGDAALDALRNAIKGSKFIRPVEEDCN